MKKEIEELNKKIETENKKANRLIEQLGKHNKDLFDSLINIENCFSSIRDIPLKEKRKYKTAQKIRLNWEESVKKIEKALNSSSAKAAGFGAVGASTGIAIVAFGPTAAMGIATTFGVASTGTAISSLSGAAATNAALAWLGGGALAAGGTGMAGGKLLLAFAGPVGWAIAAISLVASGIFLFSALKKKKRLENLIFLIGSDQLNRLKLAIVELKERMKLIDDEVKSIEHAVSEIKTFGVDYSSMVEEQKYKLGVYVNLMYASSQLLVKPIDNLKQRFNESDFDSFLKKSKNNIDYQIYKSNKDIIIYFANQFYGIKMENDDYELMWKINRKDKDLLQAFNITKNDFVESIFWGIRDALYYSRGY